MPNHHISITFLTCLALANLVACGKSDPTPTQAAAPVVAKEPEPTPEQIAEKKKIELRDERVMKVAYHVKSHLRNPDSLKWAVIRTNDDGSTVCLSYRAENGFGGMNLESAVAVGSKISNTPSNVKKYCSTGVTIDMKATVEAYLPYL